jgi:hypothetical protein
VEINELKEQLEEIQNYKDNQCIRIQYFENLVKETTAENDNIKMQYE